MAWQDILRVQFRSNESRRAWLSLLIKPSATQGQVDALRVALSAFGRGRVALVSRESLVSELDAAAGSAGPYSSHRDVARLRLACADGSLFWRSIPCLRETLIGEDTKTLLYSEELVTDLVDAMKPLVVNEAGSSVTDLIQGYRDYVRRW